MPLPTEGLAAADVLARLDALKERDVRWKEGRAFTLAYNAGDEVLALQQDAYSAFITENALNTDAFPSLRKLQGEVVDIVAAWLHGGDTAAGFMTTGGTESILMAVKAARERGRVERAVERPNMVLPTSAHAAFEKGSDYFGVQSRRIPVRSDWRADPEAMAAAVDDNTVLVVASAPQYPQGVVDPVAAVASIAADRNINCHIDACMGGVTLSYLEKLGEPVPRWDFRVPGVTSVSVDLHKFGYTAKGAGVIVHRTKQLRQHQVFITDNWLGGFYGSSGVLGTKSGGAIAAAWAVLHHLGDEGYLRLTAKAREAALELAHSIAAIPELSLWAQPEATLLSFGAADPAQLDVFAVADALWRRGWYLDRQGPPPSLHCTVNAVHHGLIGEFVSDLRASVAEVEASSRRGNQRAYGTVE
ncbi:MAG TPA: aminotransferase class V-fold PLP-dependent enzyme [Acidimicrobiales bacterium]